RASTMSTLGHGRAEKDAASGAVQWRRGDAPNAALRLSPTLAAANGQRMKPQAASATVNARAKPHATARRMLSRSPFEPRSALGSVDPYREPASKATRGRNTKGDRGPRGRGRNGKARGCDPRDPPKLDLAERQFGRLPDCATLLHLSVRSPLCGRKA